MKLMRRRSWVYRQIWRDRRPIWSPLAGCGLEAALPSTKEQSRTKADSLPPLDCDAGFVVFSEGPPASARFPGSPEWHGFVGRVGGCKGPPVGTEPRESDGPTTITSHQLRILK